MIVCALCGGLLSLFLRETAPARANNRIGAPGMAVQ